MLIWAGLQKYCKIMLFSDCIPTKSHRATASLGLKNLASHPVLQPYVYFNWRHAKFLRLHKMPRCSDAHLPVHCEYSNQAGRTCPI